MYQLFHSVEFYVVLLTVAALVVGFLSSPSRRGPAETGFVTGFLRESRQGEPMEPSILIECLPDGNVTITRYGLHDLTDAATVALAVTRAGFDISIEERVTPGGARYGASQAAPVDTATFILPGLGRERYHLKYNSQPTSTFAALTFRNTPGIRATRPLS